MSKNLILDARFSEPPSECTVFRDVSMYAKFFLHLNVLVECSGNEKDIYYYWLKSRGAFDYIDDIIEPGQENGILLSYLRGNISVVCLSADTLSFVLTQLKKIAS